MLTRFDPFREFDRVASTLFNEVRSPRAIPMDAHREGDDMHVELDLPGVDADSIELTVEQNVLSVTARRTFELPEDAEVIVSERPQGVFSRQIFLDEGLDTDRLEATYDNGVPTITAPVLESARPRKIPVSIASGRKEAIGAGDSAA